MATIKRIISLFFSSTKVLSAWAGNLALASVTMIIIIDVTLRAFGTALDGSLELVELNMLLISGFAVTYTAAANRHLKTDLLNVKLSLKAQRILDRAGSFAGFLLWSVLSYEVFIYVSRILKIGETTVTLHILRWPFVLVAGIMLVIYSLILLKQAVKPEDTWEKIEL